MSKNKIHKELCEQVIVRVEMTSPPPPRNSINWALNMHHPPDSACTINPMSNVITPIIQLKKRSKELLSQQGPKKRQSHNTL